MANIQLHLIGPLLDAYTWVIVITAFSTASEGGEEEGVASKDASLVPRLLTIALHSGRMLEKDHPMCDRRMRAQSLPSHPTLPCRHHCPQITPSTLSIMHTCNTWPRSTHLLPQPVVQDDLDHPRAASLSDQDGTGYPEAVGWLKEPL